MISLGSALFYLAMFAGTYLTVQYSIKYGNKNLTAIGSLFACTYPLLLAYSQNDLFYYVASFMGGAAWAFINVGLLNYLLEKIPADDMPAYMAWYNIILNAGILLGSLGGAWTGSWVGIFGALLIFGIGRFIAGIIILRWG